VVNVVASAGVFREIAVRRVNIPSAKAASAASVIAVIITVVIGK
jgi:hypothetical protein